MAIQGLPAFKTAFTQAVIVSLTLFHSAILYLKLVFTLMWAFLLITHQDHTWWLLESQHHRLYTDRFTNKVILYQVAERDVATSRGWHSFKVCSDKTLSLLSTLATLSHLHKYVRVCVCVFMLSHHSNIPGGDPNLFGLPMSWSDRNILDPGGHFSSSVP